MISGDCWNKPRRNRYTSLQHGMILIVLMGALLASSGCTNLLIAASANQLTDQDHSKRTLGARIEDRSIKNKAVVNLYNSQAALHPQDSHILINSYNGYVLLTGQVKTANLKKRSTQVIRDIRHVRRVYNELEIAAPNSTYDRISNLWLTRRVRISMLFTPKFPSSRVKLTSQNGTIYLMGLLTDQQTKQAVEIIRKIYGVKKIVTLVEEIQPS